MLKGNTRKLGVAVLRADAGGKLGSGHVIRSLALGETVRDAGFKVWMATESPIEWLQDLAALAGIEMFHLDSDGWTEAAARRFLRQCERIGAEWVAFDSYLITSDYMRIFTSSPLKVLLFDDFGMNDFLGVNLLVNGNVYATESLYPDFKSTQLLLGPEYLVLRNEIVESRRRKGRQTAANMRVLVTMGGSDPDGTTLYILEELSYILNENIGITVIGGAWNSRNMRLKRMAEKYKMRWIGCTSNIGRLMAQHDLAVGAGGTSAYERCAVGLPSINVPIADNQHRTARKLAKLGVAEVWDATAKRKKGELSQKINKMLDSPLRLQRMRERGMELIDGLGAERVGDAILKERKE